MTENNVGPLEAWEKALSLLLEANSAKQCKRCGCFHALVRALAQDSRIDDLFEEFVPGYLPHRMVSDPAGYFVEYPDRSRGMLSPGHYRNE